MQYSLFPEEAVTVANGVVNVANVPQLSPFRYPGGKTWLVPRLRQWLKSQVIKPREFVEPFTGGGIASLITAFEDRAHHVTMVELDKQVAAVWRVILDEKEGGEWLAERIRNFDLTLQNAQQILCKPEPGLREMAFRTLLQNRINHGGILAPGVGIIKNGENGKGIRSRWYPETLKKRILEIVNKRHSIRFIEGDGLQVLRDNADRADTVFFIDPPYTAPGNGKRAGTRLYIHNELDHKELFRIASTLKGDFLMTYDLAPSVLKLAKEFGFKTRPIAMKNTHHAEMSELLISKDLDWLL